jgi:dihydroflavonol-4-reductase
MNRRIIMKILIIGGSGMIGGDAAIYLRSLGHDITIGSRSAPLATTPMAQMSVLRGNYIDGGYSTDELAGFDAMVFAAGQDPRNLPQGHDEAAYWHRTNTILVPKLFERARDAGIGCAINIGSFYPQAAPHLVSGNSYIQSRKAADDGARALARTGFKVVSLNPPFMVGSVPGLDIPKFDRFVDFALGKLPDVPLQAPTGGVNYMSIRSLSEAIIGAIERGVSGKAYLVGDENLTFKEYFQLYFDAVGNGADIPTINEQHPLAGSFAGLGGEIFFSPDPTDTALLRYRRNDIANAVKEIVALRRNRP